MTRQQLAINRITCPELSLADFFALAGELGITQVELRNDLGKGSVTDGAKPTEVRRQAEAAGVRIITINALQHFNLATMRDQVLAEAKELVHTCVELGCPALVLCPNNDTADQRPAAQCFAETVSALQALRPILAGAGVKGLIEPLGFPESSLRSLLAARRAIDEAGGGPFQTVHDTFHHAIGPDSRADLETGYDVRLTGLVHVSGSESPLGPEALRDAHRILVGPKDRLGSKAQLEWLSRLGYAGPISFEPFAAEIQKLSPAAVKAQLRASMEHLLAGA
jgi:2-keto-myo-inositol isomerase